MDQGGGGGGSRSSSRLRDRLARMFRPATLLRSTCNTSSSTVVPGAGASSSTTTTTASSTTKPPASACSSSRALLAADAAVARDREESFLTSSRRDFAVGRTESFSTAVDRLHRRAASVAPAPPPSRFSVDTPPPPLPFLVESNGKEKTNKSPRDRLVRNNDKMKLLSNDPYGFSTSDDDLFSSSSDADDDLAGGGASKKLASSETTTFFSSDSSEFYTTKNKKTNSKKSNSNNKIKSPSSAAPSAMPPPKPPAASKARKDQSRRQHHRRAASSCDTCGVRDGFRPVVSAAEGQLRKGFAVVKRSRDPYADFRSSMVEMIVGRQLFAAPELERLLRSYLSLNAPRHHPVILQAFSDIWVVLHHGG